MPVARLAHFISRHRLALRDLTVIALVAGVGVTLAYWLDIFPNDHGIGPRARTFGSYAPIAELASLEDAAVALPWLEQPPPAPDGPVQVAGEIGRFTGPIPKADK